MSPDYKWWRASLDGQAPDIHEDQPQCGFYQRRLVKGGPWMSVGIWRDSGSKRLRAQQGGKEIESDKIWTWVAKHPITHDEFMHLEAVRKYAEAHGGPEADPETPIDLGEMSPQF